MRDSMVDTQTQGRIARPKLWLVIPSIVLSCAALLGQEGLSTLRGTVTDASGAVVPGVSVTAREVLTNVVARTLKTDAQGNYEMPGLKPGTYEVSAAHSGFKRLVVSDVALQASQVRRVHFALPVGDVASEVTVSAAAGAIETEQGKIGAVIPGGQRYLDLPMTGDTWNHYMLLSLLPTVQRLPGDYGTPSFAGVVNQADVAQDGVRGESLGQSQTLIMETAAEIKAVTANNSAQYSRISYVDAIGKSGTNNFHGSASYYHKNSALFARGFFDVQKQRSLNHSVTGSLGGPIIKNKTFFWGFYNKDWGPGTNNTTTGVLTVPTAKMRAGDFSELLGLANPVIVKDPLTGAAFPGNVIPANRLNSVGIKVQDRFLPAANTTGLVNNYNRYEVLDPSFGENIEGRVDHRFNDKNSFYARLTIYRNGVMRSGNYPSLAWVRARLSESWVATDVHVFAPNLVNTFSFGGVRDGVKDQSDKSNFHPPSGASIVKDLGLLGVNPQNITTPGGSPTFSISGFPAVTFTNGGFTLENGILNFSDSATWATGRHTVKFGWELVTYNNFQGKISNDNFGNFAHNGNWSGNAYADFLLGLPTSSTRLNPIADRTRTSKELGLFIHNSFKANSKLTLEYGLRWDLFSATTYADGMMFNWDPKTNNVMAPQSALSRVSPVYPRNITLVTGDVVPRNDFGNFAPRLGVAYRLNDKTVIRGGYGIFNEFLGKIQRVLSGGPFEITETYFNTIQNGAALFQMPNPFPSGGVSATVPSQSVTAIRRQTETGLIHQFNVTAERQIRDLGVRLSYVGSRSRGLNYSLATNKPAPSLTSFTAARRPYAVFVGTTEYRTDGAANYDSMNFEVTRRIGWVTFDAHWNWAHAMTNTANTENPYSQLFWNRDFEAMHRVVLNSAWDLPFGRGRKYLNNIPRPADHVLGGWRLNWVSYFMTGQFFSPSFANADPSNTNTIGGNPDRICGGNLPSEQRIVRRWFNTSCFVNPPAGRFGNSGRNILEGPGLHVHNLMAAKRFKLTEKVSFDFQAMLTNLFNHPNFLFPASNISAPAQAGVISGTYSTLSGERAGPRMIELHGRIQF